MNTETLLGALVESRKALVESQRAIDAILLQHTNAGNAELAGEQSAMGRISMSNGDRSMKGALCRWCTSRRAHQQLWRVL